MLQGRIQAIQSDHHRKPMELKAKLQYKLNRKKTTHTAKTSRLKKNRSRGETLSLRTSVFCCSKRATSSAKQYSYPFDKGLLQAPRFDTEQVSDIKSAINLFGDDKQSHRAAGDFLYFTAKQKGGFDNRKQIKAQREVDNVVEGNYDQQQKRGASW